MQYRRVAAAIQQDQALFAAVEALLQRVEQRRRECRGTGLVARQQVHVDQAHARQRGAADALR